MNNDYFMKLMYITHYVKNVARKIKCKLCPIHKIHNTNMSFPNLSYIYFKLFSKKGKITSETYKLLGNTKALVEIYLGMVKFFTVIEFNKKNDLFTHIYKIQSDINKYDKFIMNNLNVYITKIYVIDDDKEIDITRTLKNIIYVNSDIYIDDFVKSVTKSSSYDIIVHYFDSDNIQSHKISCGDAKKLELSYFNSF